MRGPVLLPSLTLGQVPIWFDKIENNEFGLSEFEILKIKSEIQSDENATRAGRSELEEILDDWRLPRNQNGEPAHIPKYYDIYLEMGGLKEQDMIDGGQIRPGHFVFSGNVKIDAICNTESEYIVLHAGESFGFKVNQVALNGAPAEKWSQGGNEYLVIESSCGGIGADFGLEIGFEGELRRDMKGIYQSSYEDPSGNVHYMATTQFEAAGARKTFPCFDEPEYKAIFDMTIASKYEEYSATWNMPEASRKPHPEKEDYFITEFDQSMLMSTYVMAIVISDYDLSEAGFSPETNTLVRIGGPQHLIGVDLGEYPKNIAIEIIDGFSRYYGYNYADSFTGPNGAKSDQFGIPDFAAGAMENWGLVTYKMGLIYNNPEEFPEGLNVQVASVFAHELAHQWTGNLVTCSWWDEIWINEGFADIGGYLGLRYAEPTWNWYNEFWNSQHMNGLRVDARPTTRPLINKQNNDGFVVDSPPKIMIQFDQIAYAKGGSILKMMQHVMTEEIWVDGMRQYLDERQFQLSDGEIYFSYMQNALDRADITEWGLPNGKSFNETFDGWVRQCGHPVLTVSQSEDTVKIDQERFMHLGKEIDKPESSLGYKWNVPISYIDKDGNYKLDWMLTDEQFELKGKLGSDFWLDPESHAFVRMKYGSFLELGAYISELIERDVSSMPPNFHLSISKLISDHFEMATAQIDYGIDYFHLMETTRLLGAPQLAHQPHQWPVWHQAHWAFRQSAVDLGEGELGRDTFKSPYQSSHDLMLFSSNEQVYKNYMGSLGGDIINSLYSQGSKT